MGFFDYFAGFLGARGYVLVLVALILCGLGLPVPEDIILISGGYIAYETSAHEWPMSLARAANAVGPMILVGLGGILLGDSLIYGLGRRFGLNVTENRFLRRYLTPERLARVESMFDRHGNRILIAARFMPGVRAVAFFSAGVMRVPYWKFLFYDGLAALLSAPVWVILGFRFGHVVVGWAQRFSSLFLLTLVLVFAVFLLYRRLIKRANAGSMSKRLSVVVLAGAVAVLSLYLGYRVSRRHTPPPAADVISVPPERGADGPLE